MPAAQMEPNIDQWINICQNLTPYENFALIGYLSFSYRPPLSIIATSDIVTEQNAREAEKWSESKFRKVLQFLCRNQMSVEQMDVMLDKSEAAKQLVPLLVVTLSIPLGIAVAIIFALFTKHLVAWCNKYKEQKFTGKGKYKGRFPEREVESYFEISYFPPILEYVHDPEAYPLEVLKINVKVLPESNGKVMIPKQEISKSIVRYFAVNNDSFSFFDVTINRDIFGLIDFVRESDDQDVLIFASNGLQLSPSTSPAV